MQLNMCESSCLPRPILSLADQQIPTSRSVQLGVNNAEQIDEDSSYRRSGILEKAMSQTI